MRFGALGLVEVLGSASAVMVVDKMLKTSDVEYQAKNYKCGGHVVIFVSGDVSAVTAAVDAVKQNPPCELFGTAVISNPSEETVRVVLENKK